MATEIVAIIKNQLAVGEVLNIFKAISINDSFCEILDSKSCKLDLKYSTQDNFSKINLYEGYNRAYLHRHAFAKFAKAQSLLDLKKVGYKFIVYDSFRPKKVQEIMWNLLKGTDYEEYVASPSRGSLHNFGLAIDLSLCDENDVALDMGTPFDDFTLLSQPKLELEFFEKKQLSEAVMANRKLLKSIMEAAGFIQLPSEWWHFDAVSREELTLYQIY